PKATCRRSSVRTPVAPVNWSQSDSASAYTAAASAAVNSSAPWARVLPERCPRGSSLCLSDGLTKHRQTQRVAELQRHQRDHRKGFSHGLHERRSRRRGGLLQVKRQEEARVRVVLHRSPRFESRMAADASLESTFSPKVS